MATVQTSLGADEYLKLLDDGRLTNLVCGAVVVMNQLGFLHGVVCSNVVRIVGGFLSDHDLGRLATRR